MRHSDEMPVSVHSFQSRGAAALLRVSHLVLKSENGQLTETACILELVLVVVSHTS